MTNSAGGSGTVKVAKDTTVTALRAAHSAAKREATGTARVTSHFGLGPTGTVAFTLRNGTHVVKTVKSTLNGNGVARATFKEVTKKGRYSIVGTYLGSPALTGSTGKDTFRVTR